MDVVVLAFNSIAPTFVYILIGYLCKRRSLIKESEQPRMNAIGFRVFLPVMLFYQIYAADAPTLQGLEVICLCAAGVMCVYGLSIAFVLRFEKEKQRRGTMIQAIFRSNYVLLGLPIVSALYPEAVGCASITLAVVVPIYNILAVVALEVFNDQKVNFRQVFVAVLKNPLIWGSVLGMVFMFTRLRLPAFLESSCKTFSGIATPYLLFLLGVFFRFDFRVDRSLAACLLGRLVVVPALMLTLAALLGLRNGEFAIILAVFAAPAATSSFTMAQQLGGDARLAGNTIVLGSAFSFFTILGWMCLFMALGVL